MTLAAANNSKAGFYDPDFGAVYVDSHTYAYPHGNGYITPPELTGNYPISIPTCTGDADQLLVLSADWVIVVSEADAFEGYLSNNPYRLTRDRTDGDSAAGLGNTTMPFFNQHLEIAYQLTSTEKYRDAHLLNLDYEFGCCADVFCDGAFRNQCL